jgi:hypothetical protein
MTCADKSAKKLMIEFLITHFRHWDVIQGKVNKNRDISDLTDDLDYCNKEANQIGFNYAPGFGCMDPVSRSYYLTTLRWAALRAGKRRLVLKEGDEKLPFDSPTAYITSDFDQWPILLEKPLDPKLEQWWFDEYGVYRSTKSKANPYILWKLFDQLVVQTKGTKNYRLRPEARKLIGRSVKSIPGYNKGTTVPEITLEERILLVTTLKAREVDLFYEPVLAEMKRLNQLWEHGD